MVANDRVGDTMCTYSLVLTIFADVGASISAVAYTDGPVPKRGVPYSSQLPPLDSGGKFDLTS